MDKIDTVTIVQLLLIQLVMDWHRTNVERSESSNQYSSSGRRLYSNLALREQRFLITANTDAPSQVIQSLQDWLTMASEWNCCSK